MKQPVETYRNNAKVCHVCERKYLGGSNSLYCVECKEVKIVEARNRKWQDPVYRVRHAAQQRVRYLAHKQNSMKGGD